MSVCFFIIFPKDYKLHIRHQWNVADPLTKLQEKDTKQYDAKAEDEESLTKSTVISTELLTYFSSSASYTENKERWSSFSVRMKWEPFTPVKFCPLLSETNYFIFSKKICSTKEQIQQLHIRQKKTAEIWGVWGFNSQVQDFKIQSHLLLLSPDSFNCTFCSCAFFLNTVLPEGYFPVWIYSSSISCGQCLFLPGHDITILHVTKLINSFTST